MTRLTTRIDMIEKEPSQYYKEIRKGVVRQVITFIVGAILSGAAVFLMK